MDEGVHHFDIIEGALSTLYGDFVAMRDVDLYYKRSCIFSVRFFPHGMGDDAMVSDEEYLVDRRSPLDAPPVPLNRHTPAFELRRHVPPMGDLRFIVNGAKGLSRLPHVRVIARAQRNEVTTWMVLWAGLAMEECLTHLGVAQRLLKGAIDIAARYEVLGAKKGGRS